MRFSVTTTVPLVSLGNAYLTAFVTSSFTMSPSGIARSTGRGSLDVGFERDGGAILFLHRLDQIAAQCLQIARRIDLRYRIGFS